MSCWLNFDVMHQGEALPKVPLSATLSQALLEMSNKRLGMTQPS